MRPVNLHVIVLCLFAISCKAQASSGNRHEPSPHQNTEFFDVADSSAPDDHSQYPDSHDSYSSNDDRASQHFSREANDDFSTLSVFDHVESEVGENDEHPPMAEDDDFKTAILDNKWQQANVELAQEKLAQEKNDAGEKLQRAEKLSHQKFKKKRNLLDFVNSRRNIKVVNVETKWAAGHLWQIWHLWYIEPVIF